MATAATAATPLAKLNAAGQSVWVDFMSRKFLDSGELARLIADDGVLGVTSNPTIFEKAIAQSDDYDTEFRQLVASGASADAIYQALTVSDISRALDLFRPVYDRTHALDGYVSLEVSPLLAHNSDETIREARTLWKELGRPNAMIKIPGTTECLPAIEQCLLEGINVNVTLLFSVGAYVDVAKAYVRALQRRAEAGLPLDRIASVASFFVSRIDAELDKHIHAEIDEETDPTRRAILEALLGRSAIDNAKNAYAAAAEIFSGPQWEALQSKGATIQRLLWASVGTKNPKYPDTLYIDELIGPGTVSTMPPATFEAFRDHGNVVEPAPLTVGLSEAATLDARLASVGLDLDAATAKLLNEGVAAFAKSFDDLMAAIRAKRQAFAG